MSDSRTLFARFRRWLTAHLVTRRECVPAWPTAPLYCVRHPLEHPALTEPFESYPAGYSNVFGPTRHKPRCGMCGALMYVASAEATLVKPVED